MRKFSLTHANAWSGEIFITYNAKMLLVSIDATEANPIGKAHIKWLLENAPVQLTEDFEKELLAFIKPKDCKLVEVELDNSFDTFWKVYNKMVNRKRAEDCYKKLSGVNKYLAIASVKKYDKYLKRLTWKKTKQDPDTYLRTENYKTDWDKIND
jgi:hypothetical protein